MIRKGSLKTLLAIVLAACGSGLLLTAQQVQEVGTWRTSATIADSRTGAASVTLDDGRTLIAGGRLDADGSVTDSIVIYDPVTNVREQAGRLRLPRVGHTATLLKDGRVLIIGGSIDNVPTSEIEVLDLAYAPDVLGSTFAFLNQARTRHAATRLLDGSVLIVGGSVPVPGAETPTYVATDSAEVYDPELNQVLPLPEHLNEARAGLSATTTIDGRVLIAGGTNASGDLKSAEMFDPARGFEPLTTELSVPRSGHTAILLPHNNTVLIAGGTSANESVTTADAFVPAEFPDPFSYGVGGFAPASDMPVARTRAVGGPRGDNGFAYVAGGGSADSAMYRFPTVKTDKDDYPPGQKALITGSGWEPDTQVTLVFQEDPAVHDDYVLTVPTNSDGTFSWDQWAPEQHDLNVRFYLTVKQPSSIGERRAQITFTDANPTITNVTPNSGSIAGGTSVVITASSPSAFSNGGAPYHVFFGSSEGTVVTTDQSTMTATTPAHVAGPVTISVTGKNGDAVTPLANGFTFTATKQSQTINFAALADKAFGDPDFTVSATATSGLAVSFAASGTCTVTSGTVHITGVGSCAITASQAGNNDYNAAPDIPQAFTIGKVASTTTVTVANATYDGNPHGGTANVTGAGGLNQTLTVSYVGRNGTSYPSSTTAPTNAGDYTASASFTGDTNHNASSDSKDYSIAKANQTITFGPLTAKTFGDTDFTVGATATSGLAVSFAAGGNCTVTGNSVHITGAGSCTVTASQAGDSNFNSATDVPQAFTINKATSVTVTVGAGPFTFDGTTHAGGSGTVTGAGGLSTAATSVTYTGDQVNAGTYYVTAHYAGDANHLPSDGAAVAIVINKAASVTVTVGAGPFAYDGTTHAGGSGTVTGAGGLNTAATSVTYTGDQVNAGTYYVTAHFAGDANHDPSDGEAVAVTITKAASVTVTVGAGPFTFDGTTHTGGSGTVTGAGGLTTAATSVTYTGDQVNAGTYYVTAHYAGDANHDPSDGEPVAVTIAKAASVTVTVGAGPFAYDATTHAGGSGTVTGAGGLNTVATSVTYTGDQVNAGTYYVTAHYAGDANHDTSDGLAVAIHIAKATSATVTVGDGPFTYDGTTHTGGSGTVTGAGGLSASATSLTYTGDQVNAGSYYVTAHYAGDANHDPSDGLAVAIHIAKATSATVTVGDGPFAYDATTHAGGSGTVTGAGGLNAVATSVTYTGDQVNAGTYYVTAHYAGDANHDPSDGAAVAIVINKAASVTVTVGAGPFTYDGTTHAGGSGTVTGAGGLNTAATSVTYTGDQVNTGSYYVTAHFAGDANHDPSDGLAVAIVINKAASVTVTVGAGPFAYDATTHTGGSGTVTGAGGLSTPATSVTYTGDQVNAGTYSVTAHFAGDANHDPSDGLAVAIQIAKATSATVTVGDGPFAYDGTTHAGGSGTVTGAGGLSTAATSVTYTGDQMNAGTYYVTAHFAGDANHDPSDGAAVAIVINKATSATVTVGDGPFAYDGTTHAGGSGTVTGAGGLSTAATSVTYTGDQMNAGTYYVTAHFAGDANHDPSDGLAVAIVINKAASVTVTVGAGPFTFDGTPHAGGSGTVTGAGGLNTAASSVTYSGDQVNAGTYYVTAHFAGDANHDPSNGEPVAVVINKASQTITFGALTGRTYGDADFSVSATAGPNLAVSFAGLGNCTMTGNSVHITGAGSCTITASQAGNGNYNPATNVPQTFAIAKATLTVKADNKSKAYDGTPFAPFTATITGLVNGDSPAVVQGAPAFSTSPMNPAVKPGTYGINPDVTTLVAANYAFTPGSGTLNISYGTCTSASGPGNVILPPINSNGTSVYSRKGGSTIPVKFRVCDAAGRPISDASAVFAASGSSLNLVSAVRGTVTVTNEDAVTDIPDAYFRWTGQEWIFNMATSNLTAGTTYQFQIKLLTGESIGFQVGVK